jgi:hypothetical protein
MEEQNISANQVTQQSIIKETLPNSSGVLVMGIISIASFWLYGFIALILGIIALVLSGKSRRLYNANPERFSETSYKNIKIGRICAIVGISLSVIIIFIFFIAILFLGDLFGVFQ